ncbi:MAG: Argininosuccinate synthase, partial [uncultured Corynebacteriales bacterium]
DRACRPCLLRRAGHLRGHRLDRRADRRRGGGRRGRRRPGRRGPRGGPQAGHRLRRRRVGGARPEGRVRRPLLPARPAGRRPLHGALPAGLRAVPAGDRGGPGRRRPAVRRRHRRARLHRQGQRPGPVRGGHRRARPGPGRAGPGPGLRHDPGRVDRLRRAQRPADRRLRPLAVLHRPEPLGSGRGDRLPRGPVERADRGALLLLRGPDHRPGPGRGADPLRRRGADRDRRPPGHRPAGHRGAEHPGRCPGGGPARHGRGPAGGHQEPRGLRGPGRPRAPGRTPRAGGPHGRAGPAPVQAGRRAALGRAGLRRPVVLPTEDRAGRVHRLGAGARQRRGPAAAARRLGGPHRPPQRQHAVRLRAGDLRHRRHLRPVAGQGLRAALGPAEPHRRDPGPEGRQRGLRTV